LFFECSYSKAIWWDVCDRCDIPRMRKSLDEWIRWGTVTWNGKTFRNVSHKLGFAATMYCVWQERNARIIRDKLDLMINVSATDENIRIQRAWKVNNV